MSPPRRSGEERSRKSRRFADLSEKAFFGFGGGNTKTDCSPFSNVFRVVDRDIDGSAARIRDPIDRNEDVLMTTAASDRQTSKFRSGEVGKASRFRGGKTIEEQIVFVGKRGGNMMAFPPLARTGD